MLNNWTFKLCAAVATAAALSLFIRRPEQLGVIVGASLAALLIGWIGAWAWDEWRNK